MFWWVLSVRLSKLNENQRHSDWFSHAWVLAHWRKRNGVWHQIHKHTLPHTKKGTNVSHNVRFDNQWQQGSQQLHLQCTATLYCSSFCDEGYIYFWLTESARRRQWPLVSNEAFLSDLLLEEKEKKLFADLTSAIISVCPNTVSLRSHFYHLILFRVLLKTWKHTQDGDETLLKVCPLTSAHCHVVSIYHICFWQTKCSCLGAKADVSLQLGPLATAYIFTPPWHTMYSTSAGSGHRHSF